ncbi:MAG: hypothetical protein JSW55_03425 [Chloroflexota bacterium]|nr:MAG: hypothetical protein JSW55_03425 [Chloroflexota bacterium]
MSRRLFASITLFLSASLACGVLGGELAPTSTPTVVATPTLAPTATPDPAATPLGAATVVAEVTASTEPIELAPTEEPTGSEATAESSPGGGEGGDPGQAVVPCPAAGQNLLLNSSFEGEYKPFGAFAELNHAPNWFPWWQDGENNLRPEFKPAEASIAPNRVHSGARAQQYFKSFGQFKSGLYQSVLNVTPGSRLQFSIYGQAWSCEQNDKCPGGTSVNPANMLMRVGIDPTGDTNWSADTVQWSAYFNPLDQWQIACVEAVAKSEIVTVFLWSSPDGPRQNQDVYWDDGSLVVLP